ncbi:MAG: 1-(5-phosphoribosyl)-5-[(5-phosphoribosylamino)methylideneamino]imidazole-4-carboxamide isomerase [Eubacteriales bacterium]|jgi:phosphoribosylformimino-5-aminoimidazole carboxamide ribotide isomerase|nr:1-(5-phosphoribosyl)-5-[(5-phosphoribosylamino)methylideneamino]imidazole-4-carboxamide isomerase [Eubacteriales bacterium]
MIILPAIDLYEKKAVRLYKGEYSKMTVYSEDPSKLAVEFREAGAEWLHMVDLEGARCGGTPNFDIAAKIIRTSGLSVELGGGIRDEETILRYLDAGVNRVILGTAAANNIHFVAEMVAKYGAAIAVGVDLRDGMVAVKGWTETTGLGGMDYCKSLEEIGVATVICTDIARDGAMAGANRALYRELMAESKMRFIASGGVSSLDDIRALKELGLYGAIVGKAYYTGAIKLADAISEANA